MARKKPQLKPEEAAAPARKRAPHWWALGALWLLTLLAYTSSFSGGLVLDNHFIIGADPRIHAATAHNLGLIFSADYWYGTGPADLYRPFSTLSYLFNYSVLDNGMNPLGYHVVNLALHGLNVALVYALGFWILGEWSAGLVVAGVWAVHPVLTESVTNIVGRADLLAAFGVLATLLCYLQANRSVGSARTRWIIGIVVATTVGVFSKESAIVAPAALLLYDLAFGSKTGWRQRAPGYAACIVPCILYLLLRSRVLSGVTSTPVPFADNPLVGASFLAGRWTAIDILGRYIGLLFWPVSLASDHSYNQIPLFRLSDPVALAGVAACLLAAAAAVWGFVRNRRIFFFAGLFFLAMAPVANIFLLIGTDMAERLLYLPAVGFAGCLAVAWSALHDRLSQRAKIAIPAAICLLLAARTYARNLDWESDLTLAASAAKSAPDSFAPHMVLATALTGPESVAEADRLLAILDTLPPERSSPRPYINAGISYRLYGNQLAATRPEEAASWYRKARQALLHGESIGGIVEQISATENQRLGRPKRPITWENLYLELGATYTALGQPQQALGALQRGRRLSLHPEYFFESIGDAYRATGDSGQAANALMASILLNGSQTQASPDAINLYNQRITAKLVELFRQSDPQSCAVTESRGVRTINPDCPVVHDHLCAAFQLLKGEYSIQNRPAGCPAE